jgi:thymidylate synthase ThyX
MEIFVLDEFKPQDIAMMQALYSRDASSVQIHAEKVRKLGSGKFMESYYVGYNHKSIGDCGTTTIFLEGVSMHVAKAIQDWRLYNGQETSTRYIDMAKQPIVDPVGTPESLAILLKWMNFYRANQTTVEAHLRKRYPKNDGEDEKVYDKAIKARVFDTLRGFLPAGVSTQLSWHTNLRQAYDHLALLEHHPLLEVRQVANGIHQMLKEKYPESFSHKIYDEQEAYREKMVKSYAYYLKKDYDGDFRLSHTIRWQELLAEYAPAVLERPQKTELPVFLDEFGWITSDFLLDFGSFRDAQRHRPGVCRIPLLTTQFGFQEWYLAELPGEVRVEAERLIVEQVEAIEKLEASPEVKQYYCAMGFNVSCHTAYGLPAQVYIIDLRSGRLIHPTYRKIVHKMYHAMHEALPELVFHADLDPSDFDVRRGLQDIKAKQ